MRDATSQQTQALEALALRQPRLQLAARHIARAQHQTRYRHRRDVGQQSQLGDGLFIELNWAFVAESTAPENPERVIDDTDRYVDDGPVAEASRDFGIALRSHGVGYHDRPFVTSKRRDEPIASQGRDRQFRLDRRRFRACGRDQDGVIVVFPLEDVQPGVGEREALFELGSNQRHQPGVVIDLPQLPRVRTQPVVAGCGVFTHWSGV